MQRLRTVISLDVSAVAGHHAMPAALLFLDVKKILRSATHGSIENWVLRGFRRHVVRPLTVPNLGMADWEFELWTESRCYGFDSKP